MVIKKEVPRSFTQLWNRVTKSTIWNTVVQYCEIHLLSVMKLSNQKCHLKYSSSVPQNSSTFSYETE